MRPQLQEPRGATKEAGTPTRMSSPTTPFAVRGQLLLDGTLAYGALVVRDGIIVEVLRGAEGAQLPPTVFDSAIVSPGLIDLQVNGSFGMEVGDDPEALRHLATQLPSTGVTSYLPTVVSCTREFYERTGDAFEKARTAPGARALGMHIEGPFLSPQRAGAHRRDVIEEAPADSLDALLASGHVRIVTLAPERPGALELIQRLRRLDVVVSLGHTDATYGEFVRGIDFGATMVTHLYSAMSPMRHRAPGAVGAALRDDRVVVGLIADGVHCHPAVIDIALRVKGPDRVALVTDAIAGAGVEPGTYELNGQKILVDENLAKLPDGTLAGSILTLDQAVRNVVTLAGASVPQALHMASEVPAQILGLKTKGRLIVGADADLVLFDERLGVQSTFIAGERFFTRA
jgi:N-acetylglucosamine-6-phosphate deacetylase